MNGTTDAAAETESVALPETVGAPSTSTVNRIVTLATFECRRAIRNRWGPALVALFAVCGLFLVQFGRSGVGPGGVAKVIASLVELSVYLVPLAALVYGYDIVVGSRESGWLGMLFALPVRRATILAGLVFGRAAVLAASILAGFGLTGALLWQSSGTIDAPLYAGFAFTTVLLAWTFLSIGAVISVIAPGTTHSLGAALLAWVWFVLLSDLAALAVVAATGASDALLSALVLANPVTVYRVVVLSGLDAVAGGGVATALADSGLSATLLHAGLLAWVVVPIGIAVVAIGGQTK